MMAAKPRGKQPRSLPTDWGIRPLADLVARDRPIVYGIVQAGAHVPDGVPYIRSTDVGGEMDTQSLLRTSLEIAARYKRSVVRPGDIVFSLRGNIGETSIVPVEMDGANLTQGTARISLNGTYNALFVRQALASWQLRRRIDAVSKGSTFREITLDDLRKLQVPCPPKPEQEAIARCLETWDATVRKLVDLIEAKQVRKRALMQQLLTGKRRFPEFVNSWQTVRIGEVLRAVSRPVEWDDDHTYRQVIVRRWAGGVAPREELRGKDIKVKKLNEVHAGDFLISHIQSAYGAMAVVPPEFDGYHISDLYTVLVSRDPRRFDTRFFGYLGQTRWIWHQAYLASNGFFAERLRLNFKATDFLKRHIEIPPTVEEQRKIAAVLDVADKEIDLLCEDLELLKKQKRGLMQKLLTGQVRVGPHFCARGEANVAG